MKAPGFQSQQQHRIDTQPAKQRLRATFNGEIIADTRDALAMKEGSYPVV
jgi:uncharacterized protein (DUF427 family)